MATVLSLTPNNPTVEKGKTQKFTATVTGAPEGATTEYKWEVDGVTQASVVNTLDFVSSKVGTNVIKVTATTKVDSEPDDVQEATTNLTVSKITQTTTGSIATSKPTVIPDDELDYIHPLPHRNSAYIWAGWWVMDEIEKLTNEGKDWKNPPEDSKYKPHLATLAKMITDYPEVDVQESRHGRIVHRSALDLGVIYG